jgi:hypothetical protein
MGMVEPFFQGDNSGNIRAGCGFEPGKIKMNDFNDTREEYGCFYD